MKVGILAGGRGSRLMSGEEAPPKALYEIGGMPIVWHIMQMYAVAGFREFVMLLGYKAQQIVEYFVHRLPFEGRDVSLTLDDTITRQFLTPGYHQSPWQVILCHTGLTAEKGERIRRMRAYVADDENFMVNGFTLTVDHWGSDPYGTFSGPLTDLTVSSGTFEGHR